MLVHILLSTYKAEGLKEPIQSQYLQRIAVHIDYMGSIKRRGCEASKFRNHFSYFTLDISLHYIFSHRLSFSPTVPPYHSLFL